MRLWYIVGVFCSRVGIVVDIFLGGLRGGAAAVRTVRLGMGVVVAIWWTRVELPCIWGCGRHDDLWHKDKVRK